jgi:hypothetical protein
MNRRGHGDAEVALFSALQPVQICARGEDFHCPPAEFISVEAMIAHYSVLVMQKHSLHRDELGGGIRCLSTSIVQNHSHHRLKVGEVVLVAAEGRPKILGELGV